MPQSPVARLRCAGTFTCVPGNATGPTPPAKPCPRATQAPDQPVYPDTGIPGPASNSGGVAGIMQGIWATTADELHSPTYRNYSMFHTNQTMSAQAEWDTVCAAGGQRRLVQCKGGGQCTESAHSSPYWWGLHRCDCPPGRNGLVCGGCSSDDGCPVGQRCAAPFAPREAAGDAHLACSIEQVSPALLAPMIFDFADEAVLTMDVAGEHMALRMLKPVENPEYGRKYDSSTEYAHGAARPEHASYFFLSSTVLKSSLASVQHSAGYPCPAQDSGAVTNPWKRGARCRRWLAPQGTPHSVDCGIAAVNCTGKDFHHAEHPMRYCEACQFLAAPFVPPLEVECEDVPGLVRPHPLHRAAASTAQGGRTQCTGPQPPLHRAAASSAQGGGLHCTGPQPPVHRAVASTAQGGSLRHVGL